MNKPNITGSNGEVFVYCLLRNYGHHVKKMRYGHNYDLLMDGLTRLEVKTAKPIKARSMADGKMCWQFNVHRHNSINESQVDFYVFRFEGIPEFKAAVHALFRAPLKVPTMVFTLRNLIEGSIAKEVEAFKNLNLKGKELP